ncbi:MAG: DUF4159 domain-containing protein [Cytophagales bacterium]|nr:DUF4159 domain-containing protein [Cytophagales bacterium]
MRPLSWQIFCGVLCIATVLLGSKGKLSAQEISIAKLQYEGGGDWYANRTALPNLISAANQGLQIQIAPEEAIIHVGGQLNKYPYIYMTGHGNVFFSAREVENLRNYLLGGGFLHIDDNYGLDPYVRREMKKVFPELDFVELPYTHPIYHQKYDFSKGLPKVHQHDGRRPQGFGLIHEGRLLCFYSHESDLGNGWEDASVYGDPEEVRQAALRMGINILCYAFSPP